MASIAQTKGKKTKMEELLPINTFNPYMPSALYKNIDIK